MKTADFNFLRERDFNVRVSVIDEYLKGEEAQLAYEELICDSLGVEIVGSPKLVMGNCVVLLNDGSVKTISFLSKGSELIARLPDEVKESVAVRFNIRKKEVGYKSWIISRNSQICELISNKDFNVRVSVLECSDMSTRNKKEAYSDLVRDSLGEAIVGNPNTIFGNLIVYRGDGTKVIRHFQYLGKSLMANINPDLKKCQAIRVNIRLKQGGFKSWIIAQSWPL